LAQRFMAEAVERFASAPGGDGGSGGGYFDTLADRPDLFVRTRGTSDGAIPSGNSQMIHNLLDLYELVGDEGYLDRAIRDLRSFATPLEQQGANMAYMQHALLRAIEVAPAR